MTDASNALPLEGWIVGRRDGTFEGPLAEFEPGAIRAEFMYCRELVADPFEEVGDVIDIIAWPLGRRSPWWTQRGLVTVIGEHELVAAWWDDRPARMVATPRDCCADSGTFCIIDWSAEIDAIIGQAPAVECATRELERRLRETLIRQATQRVLPTRTAQRVAA